MAVDAPLALFLSSANRTAGTAVRVMRMPPPSPDGGLTHAGIHKCTLTYVPLSDHDNHQHTSTAAAACWSCCTTSRCPAAPGSRRRLGG